MPQMPQPNERTAAGVGARVAMGGSAVFAAGAVLSVCRLGISAFVFLSEKPLTMPRIVHAGPMIAAGGFAVSMTGVVMAFTVALRDIAREFYKKY